jgi:hypothetical protein
VRRPWAEDGGTGRECHPESGGEERILLFLKKKKQKDFSRLMRRDSISPHQTNKSFLVLFFKKEPLALPCQFP